MVHTLTISTPHQGLHDITYLVQRVIDEASAALAPDGTGLCTVFIQHTSASLIIQENADPSARRDLETFLNRLVPPIHPGDPVYHHTSEGPDDMPAHIKAALTQTSLAIPVISRRLALGTWQGLYLWEHRSRPHRRSVLVHVSP